METLFVEMTLPVPGDQEQTLTGHSLMDQAFQLQPLLIRC
jgi:hypothetical protein